MSDALLKSINFMSRERFDSLTEINDDELYAVKLDEIYADDSEVVHKTGIEEISGIKTFNDAIERKINMDYTVSGSSNLGADLFESITFDNNYNRIGTINASRDQNSLSTSRKFMVYNTTVDKGTSDSAEINITKYDNGNYFASINGSGTNENLSVASSDINDNQIATKGWVNNPTTSTNLVHRSGNETIAGTKTFSSTINGTAMSALWADLAEHYETDYQYPKGTLVKFGGSKEITIADDEVNAVISSQPGLILNGNMENSQPIALCGKVPVRVIGKVNKFDYLHLSSIPGVAESVKNSEDEYPSSNVIARALEDKDTEEEGLVLCVVKFEI